MKLQLPAFLNENTLSKNQFIKRVVDTEVWNMLTNKVFSGIFETNTTSSITFSSFLLYRYRSFSRADNCFNLRINKLYKSFVVTLATLPAIVCMVIMMVNGSLGVGVAVAGTFSLVKFRSLPGTAKEIGAIFLAMGTGLATGIGYLGWRLCLQGL